MIEAAAWLDGEEVRVVDILETRESRREPTGVAAPGV
jgi:hypothetical protein